MQEIMTVEDVAAYLHVSERTVYDWAQKGDIPGGKIGTTWRFKSTDIEKWVNDRMNDKLPASKGPGSAADKVLVPERVAVLKIPGKQEVLEHLVGLLAKTAFVKSRRALLKGIFEREKLMSTGIGFGVGIPHVRINEVTNLAMAVAVCKGGVADYDSLDGEPVKIVCMLVARADQHTEYIRMLSSISSRLKEPAVRTQLLETTNPLRVCEMLMD